MLKLAYFAALISLVMAGHKASAADLVDGVPVPPAVVAAVQTVPCVLQGVSAHCKVAVETDTTGTSRIVAIDITTRTGTSALILSGLLAPTSVAVVSSRQAVFATTSEVMTAPALQQKCLFSPDVTARMITYSAVYTIDERSYISNYWNRGRYKWACDVLYEGFSRIEFLP